MSQSDSTSSMAIEVRNHVGNDVRALRKSHGYTITQLANAMDRSVGWLSQVERGQTDADSTIPIRFVIDIFGIISPLTVHKPVV